jgi:4-cresol dehydrogenase (hydroxylating) cytochrome subunit
MRKTISGHTACPPMLAMALTSAALISTLNAKGASAAPPDPSNFRWKDGPEVYAKVCSYCHDQQIGPVIRGRSLPPAYISAVVRNGNRAMPAFRGSEIDDESLKKVAEYISTN